MTIEQLKAQLAEAREKYNQMEQATQRQEEQIRENEQRKQVLFEMAEKAKLTKVTLDNELQQFKAKQQAKIDGILGNFQLKFEKYQEDLEVIEKSAKEKEIEYNILQAQYKQLQKEWIRQEHKFKMRISELDQVYIQIKAKTNEVVDRICKMRPKQRFGFTFNSEPNSFGDISNIFAPSASDIEELQLNNQSLDPTAENFNDSPFFMGNFKAREADFMKYMNLTEANQAYNFEQSKLIFEKLKFECRLLQHQREDLVKLVQEKEGS